MYEWLQRWGEPISQEMLPFVLGVLIICFIITTASVKENNCQCNKKYNR